MSDCRHVAAAGMCHGPRVEHMYPRRPLPHPYRYSPCHLANAEGKAGAAGCDVNGDETECGLAAGELGTEVRHGESGRMMGSVPSQVPRVMSTAQLHFFFWLFFFQLSCFMPTL